MSTTRIGLDQFERDAKAKGLDFECAPVSVDPSGKTVNYVISLMGEGYAEVKASGREGAVVIDREVAARAIGIASSGVEPVRTAAMNRNVVAAARPSAGEALNA